MTLTEGQPSTGVDLELGPVTTGRLSGRFGTPADYELHGPMVEIDFDGEASGGLLWGGRDFPLPRTSTTSPPRSPT